MKLIIDIDEELFNKVKLRVHEDGYIGSDVWIAVANGIPYEETPQDNLIQSLTELCTKYCKNCPVIGEADDCTDCLITHIRGIMNEVNKNETDN